MTNVIMKFAIKQLLYTFIIHVIMMISQHGDKTQAVNN